MISQSTIDKIFSAVRIEEIIGEYVQLKRAGANYKGLSPFVDEKTPSFIVSPSKQIWKDFSSGKGGTAISFLMEIEGFSYPDALRYIAKKYGIEVEEDVQELTEEQLKIKNEKELLYKIHEVANHFYQNQLQEEEGKRIGLSYFKERELKESTIAKFQLGYSPEKKNAFTQYALEKGYQKEILEKSGLSIFPENAPDGIDRFRERVIFPIHSFSGRVLGFGARILKSNVKTAKYLNSPETEIYHKSNVLYGLNQAKQAISKNNLCFLVEGYMDVISLHQAGIENVVASSGTSLTVEQIKLIKRLTENVTILFDGDNAGIKASFRSIDMLLSEGLNIRVLLFPDGDDPDSFARKNTREYVENFISENSLDFIDFKAEILLKDVQNDPIKKSETIKSIVKSIALVQSKLKQEVYLQQVSSKFGLSEQSLFDELSIQNNITISEQKPHQKSKQEDFQVIVSETIDKVNSLLFLEGKLIDLMLKYGGEIIEVEDAEGEKFNITVIEEIVNHLEEDGYSIQSPMNQKIFNEIKKGLEKEELRSGEFFLSYPDEGINKKMADVFIESHHLGNWEQHHIIPQKESDVLSKVVRDTMYRHKREYIIEMIQKLSKQEDEDKTEIYAKIMALIQLKNRIDEYFGRVL